MSRKDADATQSRDNHVPQCHQSRQLQIADLIAYLIKQSRYPSRYLKEQGAHQMIKRLTERSLGWFEV